MSTIEKTLLAATGIKAQKAGEDRAKFLARVMLAVQKLSDEEWEKLSAAEGAQDWYNEATEADNAGKAIADFPDAEAVGDAADEAVEEEDSEDDGGDDEGEETAEDEDEEEETKPKKAAKAGKAPAKAAKPAKAGKAEKPAKAEKAPAKAEKPAKAKKGTSMRRALKRMIVKKPSRTVDDLIAALEKAGYQTPSRLTITTIRADTRDTIKVLNEAGITDIAIADGRTAS